MKYNIDRYRVQLVAVPALVLALLGGCTFGGRQWSLEPTGLGAATGEEVARYEVEFPVIDANTEAVRLLQAYGVEVPADAEILSLSEIDFESADGFLVRSASLIAIQVDRGSVDAMLDWQRTGLRLESQSAADSLSPRVLDMIGDSVDANASGIDGTVYPASSGMPPQNIAIVDNGDNPALIQFLVYRIPE